ncbi:ribulose 1,5-bisphosphate carboxylase (plasmid) [Paroceanicella profunda]|uniref:Ribulose 1,5-bisphosphate carboxylase n=1 Tax=Paroceanicella profunda TaxID=2579971 RepID=A0A5B8FIL5_9RHOB|nr:RuBisCO large subunit C-terminal-like domain-containing protein [Paroceanicella profunda]QDL93941.1 ribulose 1,5-bisphosphate carboxylase [Paroceanicella profunda]
MLEAQYLVETPLDPARVAEIMAGEQSCGTFVRVEGESDDLRARAAARVLSVEELAPAERPSLSSSYLERKGFGAPWRRARVRVAFPEANFGVNLPTMAATVAGNLFDLGEVTGLRLERLSVPAHIRADYPRPLVGVAGTRASTGVQDRPLFGTIIKPNVGLRTPELVALVERLCTAGLDFIKDDETCANPRHAPLAERVPAIMEVIRRHRDRTGRQVMMAFNVTDETDAMRRHADLIEAEGGTCAMVSLNWVGLASVESLRRATRLAIHGHRNGFGGFGRHPAIGMAFPAYQALYRLAGVDHMHVHGIDGKFSDDPSEVAEGARLCLAPLAPGGDDPVMPAFSSGQWAGTLAATHAAARSEDFLFMAGGGILAHPSGAEAGVRALLDAWEAVRDGVALEQAAKASRPLAEAIDFFGART